MEIRLLTGADAVEYQALRLRALLENPEAFGSTYAEEAERPSAEVAARIADDGPGGGFVLGASVAPGSPLVGVTGCYVEPGRKRRHVGIVWGMFVAPEVRGRGFGSALLDAVIARVRSAGILEQLTLSVVPENAAARALYVARGFQPFGMAPRALRDEAQYYDLEYFWLPLHAG